jgi:hypothetical protein
VLIAPLRKRRQDVSNITEARRIVQHHNRRRVTVCTFPGHPVT